jgi:hypothetical protein
VVNPTAPPIQLPSLIGFTPSRLEEGLDQIINVAVSLPGFVDTPLILPVKHVVRSKMIPDDDVRKRRNSSSVSTRRRRSGR